MALTVGIMGWGYTYDSRAPQRRESVLPYRPLAEAPLPSSPPSWGYAYNLRGEVTGAVRGDADGAAVAGQDWGYFYDAIGNRSSSTRAGRAVIYEPNALNQYELLQHPGEMEVSGLTAPGVARVEVNGQPAAGRPAGNGEPEGFTQWLTVANSAKAVWLDVGVKATRPGEPPENTPLEMLRQGRLWVPKAQTAPEHDEDGNLLFDGRWRYAWDGENRLVSMETDSEVGLLPNAPPRLRLEYVYDGGSRRVGKVVKRWQTGAEQWVTIASWKYLYEGWNLIAELDGLRSDALERGYMWGLDLSGTFQGAGGVGGLLGVYDGRQGKVYSVMTEVNGNVMGLVDAMSGHWVARYDYDAFGNRITAAGPLAGLCPVGFSTKYTDAETGLCYYGYRYYDAVRGRWLNRDPIGEEGGLNLYGMVGNDALTAIDFLGLKLILQIQGASSENEKWEMYGKVYGYQKEVCSIVFASKPTAVGNYGLSVEIGFKGAPTKGDAVGCSCICMLISDTDTWILSREKMNALDSSFPVTEPASPNQNPLPPHYIHS